jgi:hypothetical protein
MSKHRRDCLSICRDAGLTVIGIEERGRHWAVRCAEGHVFMPNTPSDWRWRQNARAVAKRKARGL